MTFPYTLRHLRKRYKENNPLNLKDKLEILKNCKFDKVFVKTLEHGTAEEQYDLGSCMIDQHGVHLIDTVILALPLFYAAAHKGHVPSQFIMSRYLGEDNHADEIVYIKMAIVHDYYPALFQFFRNYVGGRKIYVAEPKELFDSVLKKLKKIESTEPDSVLTVIFALYYEIDMCDYATAIKYYKKSKTLSGEVERIKMVLKEEKTPSKSLREEIVKKYPKFYKLDSGNTRLCRRR
jgi:tetratricopeptide (TPR) repeat protein